MTMSQALLAPVFLHVLMTYFILFRLGQVRVRSIKTQETQLSDIALNNAAWPDYIRKISNNYDNQFQLPLLWYGCCALQLATLQADGVAVGLSWAFFLTRLVHTLIHIGSNVVLRRFQAFVAGNMVLIIMWGWFAFRTYVPR